MVEVVDVNPAVRLHGIVMAVAMGLVDRPDHVSVESTCNEGLVSLTLRVHEQEVGQVVGRQGRHARALRLLLGAAAVRAKVRCELSIEQPPATQTQEQPEGREEVEIEVPWRTASFQR